jgi:hypothetical protein
VVTPTRSPICWRRGVAPTRNPVFKSCEVAPAFAAATQTMAPTMSAIGRYAEPLQPTARKMSEVSSSVAIVIPEIGFDEEPIWPQMRELTVAKKNPKITMRTPASQLTLSWGIAAMKIAMMMTPTRVNEIGRSRSVRGTTTCRSPAAPPNPFMAAPKVLTMVGIARARLMKPPAATAPTPM